MAEPQILMTPDDLDTKSLEELDEIFAVECAEWLKSIEPFDTGYGVIQQVRWRQRQYADLKGYWSKLPVPWSSSADAVLPFLNEVSAEIHHSHHSQKLGWLWQVSVYYDGSYFPVEAEAPTFPHAAVKALIRAERAKKQASA